MAEISKPRSSNAFITPMWATPLAAPPERTKATFIERIKYKLLL
jgi:hypothetical protein